MSIKTYLIAAGCLIFIGLLIAVIIYHNKYTAVTRDLKIERAFSKQVGDTLTTYKTANGSLIRKVASLEDINGHLQSDIHYYKTTVVVQQGTIVGIRHRLDSALAGKVASIGDSIITTRFDTTYSDSGLTLSLSDSVILKKIKGSWLSWHYPEFGMKLNLINRIGYDQNANKFFGEVETHSPLVNIENVNTTFDRSFFDWESSKSSTPSYPSTFALGMNVSSQLVAFGPAFKISRWYIGGYYAAFIQNTADKTLIWYDRLQLNLAYFLF